MTIDYDKKSDSKYIKLRKAKVSKTESIFDWLFFDFDKNENVIGIEILDASKNLLSIAIEGKNLIDWSVTKITEFGKKNDSTKKASTMPQINKEPGADVTIQFNQAAVTA